MGGALKSDPSSCGKRGAFVGCIMISPWGPSLGYGHGQISQVLHAVLAAGGAVGFFGGVRSPRIFEDGGGQVSWEPLRA